MTVIVGVDLSQEVRSVSDVAAAIARGRGERLVVVHAVDGPVLPRHREQLDVELVRLRATGADAHAWLDSGGVAELLAHVARAEGDAFLVVGASGAGRRPLMGTAATAVLRRVRSPLLVVRAPERLTPLTERRPAGSSLRALVCAALDETELGVVDALTFLAEVVPIEADVAHFHLVPEAPAERHDAVRLATRDIVETLGPLPPSVRAAPLVRDAYGRLDVQVGDLARERRVDLVVCGSHHRSGLDRLRQGSVAEGIVRHAPVSVLVGAPWERTGMGGEP